MSKKDYVWPFLLGGIFAILSIWFNDYFKLILMTKTFADEFFIFASTLFGLILTSYGILFGLIPVLKKDFKESKTFKDINIYFKICLTALLFEIIFSLSYSFLLFYNLFVVNMFIIGFILGMFAEIIFLLSDLYHFIIDEN